MLPWESRRLDLLQATDQLGLTPALVLDAGDIESYAGSGNWLDLTANNRDFTNVSATFTGTAGQLSAGDYWSFGGAAYFTGTNDTFWNGLHKDDAVHTLCFLIYYPTVTASTRILCTSRAAGDIGIRYLVDASAKVGISFNNAGGFQTLHTSTAGVTANAWNFIGVSFTEGGGAGASFVNINGTVETFNGAITSPSSSNATRAVSLFAHENGTGPLESGSRAMFVLGDDTNLSQAQVEALRSFMVARV